MNVIASRPPATPWTYVLLALVAAGYVAQQYVGDVVEVRFALWPLVGVTGQWQGEVVTVGFEWWQIVTYSLLHGSPTHLLFNALALWMFGRAIEAAFGSARFIVYWLACVVGAGVAQLVTQYLAGEAVPTVGASGGVFGLLLAFGVLFPRARIMLIFPPIPMPAWLFVIGYGLVEIYLGFSGRQPGVAHFAHLGGMVAGIPFVVAWYRRVHPRRLPPTRREF